MDHHWDDLGRLKSQPCCNDREKMKDFLSENFSILGIVGLLSCAFMAYGCQCAVKILTVPILALWTQHLPKQP